MMILHILVGEFEVQCRVSAQRRVGGRGEPPAAGVRGVPDGAAAASGRRRPAAAPQQTQAGCQSKCTLRARCFGTMAAFSFHGFEAAIG